MSAGVGGGRLEPELYGQFSAMLLLIHGHSAPPAAETHEPTAGWTRFPGGLQMLPLPGLAGLPSFAGLAGLPALPSLASLAALAALARLPRLARLIRLAGLSWLARLIRLAGLELMRFVLHGIVIDTCNKSCCGDHDGHSGGHCENYQQGPLE